MNLFLHYLQIWRKLHKHQQLDHKPPCSPPGWRRRAKPQGPPRLCLNQHHHPLLRGIKQPQPPASCSEPRLQPAPSLPLTCPIPAFLLPTRPAPASSTPDLSLPPQVSVLSLWTLQNVQVHDRPSASSLQHYLLGFTRENSDSVETECWLFIPTSFQKSTDCGVFPNSHLNLKLCML